MIALIEAKRAGLLKQAHLWRNCVGGTRGRHRRLPLAMAFAIASGATPEQGLYTAIIAGLATSMLGGTRVQISGPTGAFIAVLAGITAQYGIAGLQVATLMAGFILLVMGLARLGGVIKFIPNPVIVGFTTGIAVIIWVGQWKDFFGLHPMPSGLHFHEKLWALVKALPGIDARDDAHRPAGTRGAHSPAIACSPTFPGCAGCQRRCSRCCSRWRAAVVPLSERGDDRQRVRRHPANACRFSRGRDLSLARNDATDRPGVRDRLARRDRIAAHRGGRRWHDRHRHNSNQELIGQGAANILAPLFGGFAATGAIARTATNIRNGATSPLAGVVHAVFLMLVIVVLAPWARASPLAALAAILFFVAWNMCDLRALFAFAQRPRRARRRLLLLITFA